MSLLKLSSQLLYDVGLAPASALRMSARALPKNTNAVTMNMSKSRLADRIESRSAEHHHTWPSSACSPDMQKHTDVLRLVISQNL